MRTGMSWCAGALIAAALFAGHRLWTPVVVASPPALLPSAEAAAPPRTLPQQNRSVRHIAGDDRTPPESDEPRALSLQPPATGAVSPDEAEVRAIIESELKDASEEEREIFFEQFRAYHPGAVRDLLSVRRDVGSAQRNSPLFAPLPALSVPPSNMLPLQTPSQVSPRSAPESIVGAAEILREAIRWHQHNLLNSPTPGYRRVRVLLTDRTSTSHDAPLTGIELAPLLLDVVPGGIEQTGRPLDVALSGNAWLSVRRRDIQCYTRCGALMINGQRRLATVASGGAVTVEPEIVVPEDVEQVSIESDGRIFGETPGDDPRPVGRLPLVTFMAPELLRPIGGTLLTASSESGPPSPIVPAEGEQRPVVQPRSLERSNVDPATERNNIRFLTEQLELLAPSPDPLAAGIAPTTRQ